MLSSVKDTSEGISKLKIVTWNKDAHGLFDYESDDINKEEYIFKGEGSISRDEDNNKTIFEPKVEDCFFLTGENKTLNEKGSITEITQSEGKFILNSSIDSSYEYNLNNLIKVQKKLWTVIGQKEEKGIKKEYFSRYEYNFKIGDLIRFGRVQYYITDIFNKNAKKNGKENYSIKEEMIYNPILSEDNLNKNIICMSCKKRDNSDSNPLIKICKCDECMDYIHINCYKIYIKNSEMFGIKETNLPGVHIISIYNLICDHCKEPLNTFVKRKGKIFSILPYSVNKPSEQSYIVLTSLNFIRESVFTTNIIIFYFPTEKEEYFLGRGHEATFRVNDISISRVHAKIYMKNGLIKVDDLGSKFGTLLLLRNDLEIEEMKRKKMKIEAGRSVFWID